MIINRSFPLSIFAENHASRLDDAVLLPSVTVTYPQRNIFWLSVFGDCNMERYFYHYLLMKQPVNLLLMTTKEFLEAVKVPCLTQQLFF